MKPIPTWAERTQADKWTQETTTYMQQEIDALRTRLAEVEKDALRYQAIRNPPYSENYGDLYAMTFQRMGDIPIKGADLDAVADSAIARAMGAQP